MKQSNKTKSAGRNRPADKKYMEYWTVDKKLHFIALQNVEITRRLKILKYLAIVIVSLLSALLVL